MSRLSVCAAGALVCFGSLAPLAAQQATPGVGGWDVTARHAPVREIEIDTDEGTWMSVDVSPDGRRLVFDLLGDIYTMPIGGGEATLLLGGPAMETQPRFSPDGRSIAFTSDRGGMDNLWIASADGSGARQVTTERERQVNSPVWTPDGRYLIGRKHFRNTRSLGAGEMWLYHVDGGGGLRLTERRNWQQNAADPALSPDGRYLYFSEDVSPGDAFDYNRDPYGVIYVLQRLDRETGERETYLRAPGGTLRPEVSPDGRTLAFVRRVGLKSVLFLHDLESGRETALFDRLDHDQQEAWAIFGTYPRYAWTPDGRSIVVFGEGKLWRVDVASKRAEPIPFRARARHALTEVLRFPVEVAPDRFDVKMLRWVTVSPDQRTVVYSALGKLWIRALPDGEPRRLTREDRGWELYPAWSPDSRTVVYTTWSDDSLGAVRTVGVDGRGGRRLTPGPGHYAEPAFSPDGRQVAYRRMGGDLLRGELYARDTGIYRVPAAGGDPVRVTGEGARPSFDRAGERIFLQDRHEGDAALVSVDLDGGDRRVHLVSDNATSIVPSPDERMVALVERFNVHLAPFPRTGQPVRIGPETTDYPVRRLSRDAGLYVHWTADSRRLYWALGPELFHRDLGADFDFAAGSAPEPESEGRPIGFRAEADRPTGKLALVGATVITMRGEGEVIPDATVVVERNRIVAVGPSSEVVVPADARRVDVTGRYLMPGLIDVHAHGPSGSGGIVPQTHWSYLANLAFGVTTLHDPSNGTEQIFSNSELGKAGLLLAPRLFSTGTILYGGEGDARAEVGSYEDALSHVRRMKAVGAFSVKSYNQPRRDARQMIVEAARAEEMMVVPEGGSTYHWNVAQILDGHTGIEHNVPVRMYGDVLTLFSSSEVGYTPTLVVSFGGLSGEYYWYQESNVWENERLRRYFPVPLLDARARRRQTTAEDDYWHVEVSKGANRLEDMGGRVQLGAHGQLQGLGAHWELWMLGQGGMTPAEALRAATLSGAEYLGLDRDLGSVEVGKLADLVVLDRDPLADLRNSESLRYVMVNGRLFDAATLQQIGNHPAPAPDPARWQAGVPRTGDAGSAGHAH